MSAECASDYGSRWCYTIMGPQEALPKADIYTETFRFKCLSNLLQSLKLYHRYYFSTIVTTFEENSNASLQQLSTSAALEMRELRESVLYDLLYKH